MTRKEGIDLNQKYTLDEVDYAFGSMNNQVSDDFRVMLNRAISTAPKKVVDWTVTNILFVSSKEEAWAYTLNPEDWPHVKGLVFLCETLKSQSSEKQTLYILHEIAHVRLRHRSPILSNLSQEESERQEREADKLARSWLEKRTKRRKGKNELSRQIGKRKT
jgi:hypothetical protein